MWESREAIARASQPTLNLHAHLDMIEQQVERRKKIEAADWGSKERRKVIVSSTKTTDSYEKNNTTQAAARQSLEIENESTWDRVNLRNSFSAAQHTIAREKLLCALILRDNLNLPHHRLASFMKKVKNRSVKLLLWFVFSRISLVYAVCTCSSGWWEETWKNAIEKLKKAIE